MSEIDTNEFRKLLEEERGRLMQASGRLESDTSEDLGEERGVENHLGDQASETYERSPIARACAARSGSAWLTVNSTPGTTSRPYRSCARSASNAIAAL